MANPVAVIVILAHILLLPLPCVSDPLCTDSRAPFSPNNPLQFCPYNGSACCDTIEDMSLQNLFQSMNIPDPACASLVKAILCAKCDQFSADLYEIDSETRTVPALCTVSELSTLSKDAESDFCAEVWDTCCKIPLVNSPFAALLRGRSNLPVNSTSKLTDLWHSKGAFCEVFGGPSNNGRVCFDGRSVSMHNTGKPETPNGVCLEKIANGSYIDMAAYPDGSNRIFLGNLEGRIWLATVPEEGSGETLVLDESNPFLDITDILHFDPELGMMSMAFHPNFTHNGRFFISFNCDKLTWSGCYGRCSCNTDVGCDPSKFHNQNGDLPCQNHIVVSEFSSNITGSKSSLGISANPSEVRRIFTMGIMYKTAHGGQILFGPDGYLYLMIGDGEDENDGYDFAQNKKSLLGKILRLDVDNVPTDTEIKDLDLWGNYSIPSDNPHSDDKELRPEIWAFGLRNPWRCSFDSNRPSYFLCGECGKDHYEEVNIITKGGNYGWIFYEGTTPSHLGMLSAGNTSTSSLNLISPVMGYEHSSLKSIESSASITGGHFYRSRTDPCMYGRYLYTDLYGSAMWAGTEIPENSGNFTSTELSFSCAHDSPIRCRLTVGNSPVPSLGFAFSMGTDNRKDVFILTSNGVLRVARPSRCNYTCSKEVYKAGPNPRLVRVPSTRTQTSNSDPLEDSQELVFFSLLLSLLLLLLLH